MAARPFFFASKFTIEERVRTVTAKAFLQSLRTENRNPGCGGLPNPETEGKKINFTVKYVMLNLLNFGRSN